VLRYTIKRILWMIPIVLCVSILVFTLMYFAPGEPAKIILGPNASVDQIEVLEKELGLDQPYLVRLVNYLNQAFLHGDLGKSWQTNVSISESLMQRLPRTLILSIMILLISLIVGIPLGISAATHQNQWKDTLSMFIALLGVSMPSFWLALLLVLLFSVKLGWLPATGYEGIEYYILPMLAGCWGGIATMARQTRSSMLEVIRSDYVTTARAKGLKERSVIYKHALPNALIPIITMAGTSFGRMLGGTVVLETIFAIPGVGTYMIGAVNSRDYPVVQGGVIFLAIAFSVCMLIVDLVYAAVDPRIKAQYEVKKKVRKNEEE
jgi:peptide/nickel transport system permease protein